MANVTDSLLMDIRSSTRAMFRAGFAVLAVILVMQAVWIFLAEAYRLNRNQLPTDPGRATVTRTDQDRALKAASLAVIRGDLWAESAFTYAGQIWTDHAMQFDNNDPQNERARASMVQALRYSPHRGDVWLMFAAMAERNRWPGYQPNSLLKISYYTAPNEIALFPLRLTVALQLKSGVNDEDLRELVRRDIRIILTHNPALRPTLVQAYRSASAAGKSFLEQVITEIDPSYVSVVRAK